MRETWKMKHDRKRTSLCNECNNGKMLLILGATLSHCQDGENHRCWKAKDSLRRISNPANTQIDVFLECHLRNTQFCFLEVWIIRIIRAVAIQSAINWTLLKSMRLAFVWVLVRCKFSGPGLGPKLLLGSLRGLPGPGESSLAFFGYEHPT